jgi:hypothetical protein
MVLYILLAWYYRCTYDSMPVDADPWVPLPETNGKWNLIKVYIWKPDWLNPFITLFTLKCEPENYKGLSHSYKNK